MKHQVWRASLTLSGNSGLPEPAIPMLRGCNYQPVTQPATQRAHATIGDGGTQV